MHKLAAICLIVFPLLGAGIQAVSADESSPPLPSCTNQTQAIQAAIEEANYCSTSEDCAAEVFGCPFGCEDLLHRSQVPIVAAQVAQFHATCDVCMYKCPATPPGSRVTCVDNKCVRADAETQPTAASLQVVPSNKRLVSW